MLMPNEWWLNSHIWNTLPKSQVRVVSLEIPQMHHQLVYSWDNIMQRKRKVLVLLWYLPNQIRATTVSSLPILLVITQTQTHLMNLEISPLNTTTIQISFPKRLRRPSNSTKITLSQSIVLHPQFIHINNINRLLQVSSSLRMYLKEFHSSSSLINSIRKILIFDTLLYGLIYNHSMII